GKVGNSLAGEVCPLARSLGLDFVCFPAGTSVATSDGAMLIEQLRVGDRLATASEETQLSDTQVDPATWRTLVLKMPTPRFPADVTNLELLRPVKWIDENQCQPGNWIWISLKAIDMEGWARVERIDSCPQIKIGRGRVVIGALNHLNDDLLELKIDGYER